MKLLEKAEKILSQWITGLTDSIQEEEERKWTTYKAIEAKY